MQKQISKHRVAGDIWKRKDPIVSIVFKLEKRTVHKNVLRKNFNFLRFIDRFLKSEFK